MPTLRLPAADGRLEEFKAGLAGRFPDRPSRPFNRVAIAAAHVVADPLADVDPWLKPAVDWESTIAYRRHLWRLGLGAAPAMATPPRGTRPASPPSLPLTPPRLPPSQPTPP